MGVFEDVVSKAKTAADYAGKKTNEIVELSKLRFTASEIQGKIDETMRGLGESVYNAAKADTDCSAAVKEKSGIIDDLNLQLEKINEKIAELKRMKTCPSCDYSNPEEANFCQKCGAKL